MQWKISTKILLIKFMTKSLWIKPLRRSLNLAGKANACEECHRKIADQASANANDEYDRKIAAVVEEQFDPEAEPGRKANAMEDFGKDVTDQVHDEKLWIKPL